MELLELLHDQLVPGDGAMGTMLMDAGIPLERSFEELCVSNRDLIRKIHEEYIEAGARLIETNSFGANAVRLARFGLEHRVSEINWSAAQIAKECAKGKDVVVAGSVGPLGMSAEDARQRGIDRRRAFEDQIGALLDGGCRVIFLETFQDLDELLIALEVKHSLHHCPVICSLACGEEGRLPDGTLLSAAFDRLRAAEADMVGVNCANGPQAMLRLLERIPVEPERLLSAFPNAGYPQYRDGRYRYSTSPEYFAAMGLEFAARGARLIGGCCGTTPHHIAALANAFKEKPVPVVATGPVAEPPKIEKITDASPKDGATALLPQMTEPSILEMIAAGHKVIVTELDPPKTLDLERFYAGASALQAAGTDAVTLADNSLAILRVGNLAVAAELKRRGILPLLHLNCRDRNVIGLQSELMGMAALGIRHVLPLTGDPSKVGDHPGATSVYDVTSIELMKIIGQLNKGLNANGKSIKYPTRFVSGCTFNPNAKNMDAQLARLERKIAGGAQYVMTQPVFDTALVEETTRRTASFGVPVFIGVWPLLNGRQAEFLHNEVPGITIPEAVRLAIRGLEGAEGRSMGMVIARDMCRAILDHFPGVYLITPFLQYETTVELAHFVRAMAK